MPVWSLGQSQNLRGQGKFSSPPQTSHQFHVLSRETHLLLLLALAALWAWNTAVIPGSPITAPQRGLYGIFFLGSLLYCAKAYSPHKTKSTMFESRLSENTFIRSLPRIGFQIENCLSSLILKASFNFLIATNVAFEQSNPFLILFMWPSFLYGIP